MLFKVGDYENVPVILTKDTWYIKLLDPVFGHPEVKPYLKEIKNTIKYPNFVFQSIRDPRSKLLFLEITDEIYPSHFLVVVVKYVKKNDKITGYVSTVMINRKLPRESKLLWERKVLT